MGITISATTAARILAAFDLAGRGLCATLRLGAFVARYSLPLRAALRLAA